MYFRACASPCPSCKADPSLTGRIGSRRHLAENAWLVSLGCSGGAQRPCRVHLHIIQLGFEGKPILLKNWPIFPICMWKWGGSAPSGQARVSRPNWPQCAKSHAAWQSLSSRAEKLRIFSRILFFHFWLFFGFWWFFCRFLAVGHILRLACFLAVLAAPGWQNSTLVAGKTLILKNWPIYGRYGHIPGTGARFSNAVRGVSRVICGWY